MLGNVEKRPTHLDKELGDEISACHNEGAGYDVIRGKTMCTSDFYEGKTVVWTEGAPTTSCMVPATQYRNPTGMCHQHV